MALDYLLIQASLVPSKRVFSSSAETDTKRWNWIHPEYYADEDEDSADLIGKLTLQIRDDGIDIDQVIHIVGQDNEDW